MGKDKKEITSSPSKKIPNDEVEKKLNEIENAMRNKDNFHRKLPEGVFSK